MTTAVQPAFQSAINKKITFPSWPHFEADEIEAVAAVLRSGRVNYWTGDEGCQFEHEFAEFCGTKHAVCLANGTLALELASAGDGNRFRRRSHYDLAYVYRVRELRRNARGSPDLR